MPNYCPHCGSELNNASTFCGNCGAPVQQEMSAPTQNDTNCIRLDRPIPEGITVTPDGGYQWTASRSVWGCLPFFKIMHIVCAVLAMLICILILAFESGDDISATLLYCGIAIAGMIVLDLLICLFYAAKRGFRLNMKCTLGRDGVSGAEIEVPSNNGFVLFVQLITGLLAHGDVHYSFSAGYDKIRELTSSSDKTKIKIGAGAYSGFLLTAPEQHDFVLDEIRIRMNRK